MTVVTSKPPLIQFPPPPMSTLHPLNIIHVISVGLPAFHSLPLLCIILNAKRRTKHGGGLGTRLKKAHNFSVRQIYTALTKEILVLLAV